MNEYMEFCFEQQDTVLSLTDMSKDEFVDYWSDQVATALGLDYTTLLGLYDRDSDVHDTEMKTRAIWKYGAARGISGTPTALINGAKLDTIPATTDGWLQLLDEVW